MSQTTKEIRPQQGPQEQFLSSSADIVFYGGAAGGGKTWALLLEPLRHIKTVDGFGGIIFRRESVQITNEGGLWDESETLYPLLGAQPRQHSSEWKFPPYGNRVSFRHMQYDKDRQKYQGAQIPYMAWDELTHFSRKQFLYMLSRSRSTCGVSPYVRAGYNPVPPGDPIGGWIHEFVEWYLDDNLEYPDPTKTGVIRYFVVINDTVEWGDSREEIESRYPGSFPLSFTFIPAYVTDNKILLDADPSYIAKLSALGTADQERLLKANHKIEDQIGGMFKREYFSIVDAVPDGAQYVRYWDKAGTKDDGDSTAGLLMAKHGNDIYIVDYIDGQWEAPEREQIIRQTAATDRATYGFITTGHEQEPGSGGKESAQHTARVTLSGYSSFADKVTGDKVARAEPMASHGRDSGIKMVQSEWNRRLIDMFCRFPAKPRDGVDAGSGSFNYLAEGDTQLLW